MVTDSRIAEFYPANYRAREIKGIAGWLAAGSAARATVVGRRSERNVHPTRIKVVRHMS